MLNDVSGKNKMQGFRNAAVEFARDVKQSLLLQHDWATLLSVASLCVSLTGSCYVVAISPLASSHFAADSAKSQWADGKLKYAVSEFYETPNS